VLFETLIAIKIISDSITDRVLCKYKYVVTYFFSDFCMEFFIGPY